MSLARLLPSLRAPVARRTCAAAFSSSVSARNGRTSEPLPDDLADYFDDTIDQSASAAAAAEAMPSPSYSSIRDQPPPSAPEGSYPRTVPSQNPLTEAKKNTKESQSKPMYSVFVKASRNNTIITFARPNGNQLVTLTGGKLGFKKSNRNGYEAGYQCAVGVIEAIEREMVRVDFEWELFLNGFGQGRDAMLTAIMTSVGMKVKPGLKRVTDRTPLKIGGTRGQKTRRV